LAPSAIWHTLKLMSIQPDILTLNQIWAIARQICYICCEKESVAVSDQSGVGHIQNGVRAAVGEAHHDLHLEEGMVITKAERFDCGDKAMRVSGRSSPAANGANVVARPLALEENEAICTIENAKREPSLGDPWSGSRPPSEQANGRW